MVAPHVSIVTLGVADVAASTSFYEALGLRRSSASNDVITFLRCGAIVLSLYRREPLADDVGIAADGQGFRAVTLATNLSSAEEVDDTFAQWVAAGAEPIKAPASVFWGGYSSYVADRDGHLWELAFNPYTPVLAEGRLQLSD
jgi:predicted lactoylglutathione lyase